MSFWKRLFGGAAESETVALIEVESGSIAGGLAYFKNDDIPCIVYGDRVTVEHQPGEGAVQATSRTLRTLCERLITDGAPRLAGIAGNGRIDSVLVLVKAPWQETCIRSEKTERTTPFTFTRSMLHMALEKSAKPPAGRFLADEIIIGTVLDGYETKKPIGKKASRVSILVLSSFIDEILSVALAKTLREIFHTRSIRLVAASALRYEALRAVFPHEEDYLTVDIAGTAVVTSLIRRGLLSAIEHATVEPSTTSDVWIPALTKTLEGITTRYPLPRKILLLADEGQRLSLKQRIESAPLQFLRLSDEPPIVIPIAASHFTNVVRILDGAQPDLGLELMAAFWQYSPH